MATKETIIFGGPFSTDPKSWTRRANAKRSVPMKVLVLGLPRTGTSSMVQALKILGYDNVHHMATCISNPLENELWLKAIDAKWGDAMPLNREDWDALLGDCMAVTDFPSAAFPMELIKAYPEAKVILTTRPFDAWYSSINETVGAVLRSETFKFFAFTGDPFFSRWHPMVNALWAGFFGTMPCGCPMLLEEDLKYYFSTHHSTIRMVTRPERLYERDISEGWEGICKFLGKPVPSVPYPRTNDKEEFKKAMNVMAEAGLKRLMLIACKVLAVALGLWTVLWLLGVPLRVAGLAGREI
ncbi:hypothetical protein LTR08_003816 [Meristemomyces frigidus]|nr:hypothetical protein LTR08_003816 [Meristemomyces frigidus]